MTWDWVAWKKFKSYCNSVAAPRNVSLHVLPNPAEESELHICVRYMGTWGTIAELFTGDDLWTVPRDISKLATCMRKSMKQKEEPSAVTRLKELDDAVYNAVSCCASYDVSGRPNLVDLWDHLEQILSGQWQNIANVAPPPRQLAAGRSMLV